MTKKVTSILTSVLVIHKKFHVCTIIWCWKMIFQTWTSPRGGGGFTLIAIVHCDCVSTPTIISVLKVVGCIFYGSISLEALWPEACSSRARVMWAANDQFLDWQYAMSHSLSQTRQWVTSSSLCTWKAKHKFS